MPILPRQPIDQPFVRSAFVPGIGTLQDLLGQQGQVRANMALQRGQGAAATWASLANAFNQYQQTVRAQQVAAAALAEKQQTREDANAIKLLDLDEKAAERKEQNRIRLETEGRAKRAEALARAGVTQPGVLSSEAADALKDSGRVQIQDGVPVLMRTPEQVRQAGLDLENKTDRENDNLRMQAQLDEQRRHNMQTEAQTKARDAKGANKGVLNLPGSYGTAFSRAIMSAPAMKRAGLIQTANDIAASGTEDDLKSLIRQAAIEGENVDIKNQTIGRMTTIRALQDAKSIIEDMKRRGVPTNILSGSAENVARKLGKTTNPEYVKLAQNLQDVLINYRRAATGAAFGQNEGADYARMFPTYTNDFPVNDALLDGLIGAMSNRDRSYWEYKLGPEGADLVSPSSAAKKKNPNR